jgi:hypothetical protein
MAADETSDIELRRKHTAINDTHRIKMVRPPGFIGGF